MPLPPQFPDLAALDLFCSVVELGSVSAAARSHLITQPSASSRISTLESQLGVTLLDRSATGSVPTAAGQLVAGWAESIVGASHDLWTGAASIAAERAGLLRLSASYTIAEYLLPPRLEAFLADRPDDSVSLDVTNSRAVISQVESGSVDLGFVESPTIPSTLTDRVIATDELIPVVSARHAWAKQRVLELDEFIATPMVLRESGSGTRDSLEARLEQLGCERPRSALDLGSISAVRIAVVSGSSPTVISRLAVADDLAQGRLVELEIAGLTIARTLRAVWPRRRDLPRLAGALLDSDGFCAD